MTQPYSACRDWMYAKEGQKLGPLSLAELQQKLATGEIGISDLVWRDGMPDWAPAGQVPELTTPNATEAIAGASPGVIGYFGTGGALPARAQELFAKRAHPTGDRSHWPCTDSDINDWDNATKVYKALRNAASLFNLIGLFLTIAAVMSGIAFLFALMDSRRGSSATFSIFGAVVLFYAVLAAVHLLAARATRRAYRWGALAMTILFALGTIISVGSLAFASTISNRRQDSTEIVMSMFTLLVGGCFTWIAAKAYIAVPKFRDQPAWCQELLARSKL